MQSKQEEVETLTQEINSKVESLCSLTFKPSHEIIKHSTDVAIIMTKMDDLENESNGVVSTIYLLGNPGCGKSQIARQVGQEVFDKKSRKGAGLTFVATLNSETQETLANSYFSFAKQLKITEYTLTKPGDLESGLPRGNNSAPDLSCSASEEAVFRLVDNCRQCCWLVLGS